MLLALFPAPASGGSFAHGVVVAVGFCLLAVWPVLAVRRRAARRRVVAAAGDTWPRPTARSGRTAPWGLRPAPSVTAAALMWLGGAWFLLALYMLDTAGAAERVLTFAQSFWPLVVVVSCFRHEGDDGHPG